MYLKVHEMSTDLGAQQTICMILFQSHVLRL